MSLDTARDSQTDLTEAGERRPGGFWATVHRIRQHDRFIFVTMLVSACASLVASFVLSVDALRLAADPGTQLSCDISSTLSCGTVAQSWQAQLLGFPNAFLGLIAEPVVITIAVAALGGVRFPRWFMVSAQTVYTLGVIFAYWLFVQSMFVIHALCPWCLLVTVSTTLVFTSLTHVNIRDGNLPLPPRMLSQARALIAADVDAIGVAAWLVFLAAAILARYGVALFG
ncbi:vitamin K epoxide reductase family protein [Isoptericola sp. b441]|uniref:Vitamin K epoxide reductase family protein n=1 Tax=Actinotalea lenta TaxID=3064654 RepID=A0ABT9D9Q5_9CELL|nr:MULTISPECIES: vitamin K epoxide reductase family protein [unclassified Isoptericola]MDO8107632.1 vitamin K epoxide reductase family protein [Isoptericola sp. b441]MDO8120708.1 vitamin K epoxide reductase family protein [Isoptericola sp. b490]